MSPLPKRTQTQAGHNFRGEHNPELINLKIENENLKEMLLEKERHIGMKTEKINRYRYIYIYIYNIYTIYTLYILYIYILYIYYIRLDQDMRSLYDELDGKKGALEHRQTMEVEMAALREDNTNLREELKQFESERAYLERIKEMLRERHPSLENLMEISLKQERDKQERQNEKILNILKIKDNLIEELQQKSLEQENRNLSVQQNVNELKEKTQEQNIYIEDLTTENNKYRTVFEEHEETIKLLNTEMNRYQYKMSELEDQLTTYRETSEGYGLLQSEIETLSEENNRKSIKLQDLTKELGYYSTQYKLLKSKEDFVKEINTRNTDTNNIIMEKERELEKLKIYIDIERKNTQAIESKLEVVETERERENKLWDGERENLDKLYREVETLRGEKSLLENRLQQIGELYKGENDRLMLILEDLDTGNLGDTDDLLTLEDQEILSGRDLDNHNNNSRIDIDDLRKSQQNALGRLSEKVDVQRRELALAREEINHLEVKYATSQRLLTNMQEEKLKVIEEYQAEVENLRETIEELGKSNIRNINKHMDTQTELTSLDINTYGIQV